MKEFKIAEEGGYSIYKLPGIDNEKVKDLVNKFANEIFEIGKDMNFYYHKARRSNDNRKVKIPKERIELSKEEFKERLKNYLLTPNKEDEN